MISEELALSYMNGFYGYGNYKAPYWFVGMEEGGGKSRKEIEKRLNVWRKRGSKTLEDVAEYHHDICVTKYFKDEPKLQRTWKGLIRIVFAINGVRPTVSQIRDYQKNCLARKKGETCLVELLPLPSRNSHKLRIYANLLGCHF